MKRVVTLLILLLTTGMILPSCGVSLEKRQHTGGYYVNVNPRNHTAKNDADKQKHEAIAAEAEQQAAAEEVVAEEEVAEITPEQRVTERPVFTEETPAIRTSDAAPAYDEAPAAVHQQERTSIVAKVTDKVSDRLPFKGLKSKKANSASGASRDGLSLFWIVILVLLVLWAAGLIGGGWGLGWVINVLLVIALVLLILWLLRIV